MIRYEITTIEAIIIDQMNKFFENCLNLEFELKKLGKTKIKTKVKKRAGIICSNPIF
tara:strand:- start:507 stop:677 length:171 start_codon:yes stop_codon:yes gene_type:complete